MTIKKIWLRGPLSGLNEWRGFLIFMVLMALFRSACADWVTVPSGSMNPAVIEGDRC